MLLRSIILSLLLTTILSSPQERSLSLRMFSKEPQRPARKLRHSKIQKELKRAEIKVEKKDVNQEIKEEKKSTAELKKQIGGLERTLKEMKTDLHHNEMKLKKMNKMNLDNEKMKKKKLKGRLTGITFLMDISNHIFDFILLFFN